MSFCYPLRNYCFPAKFRHPKITPTLTRDIDKVRHSLSTEIAYTSILLAISVTFPFLPVLGGIIPQNAEEVNSVESTKTQILDLATSLTYDQDSFIGKRGGIPTKGATFLAQLALSYGGFHTGTQNP